MSLPAPMAFSDLDRGGIAGHPRGLTTLFFTELWERFSYYGMRALLILFMTAPLAAGGLGLEVKKAAAIYGLYTFGVYFMAIPGGIAADLLLGARRAVLWGGILIALGHFSLALGLLPFFYAGLVLIVTGTGLLKPNISVMVGHLYAPGDNRRDAGFSLFYMGINLGGLVSPIVCGFLGQQVAWRLGFGAAGVGMTLGLAQYLLGRDRLGAAGLRAGLGVAISKGRSGAVASGRPDGPAPIGRVTNALRGPWFTAGEWKRIAAIAVLFVFSAVFWAAFEQAGSSFNLFADRRTRDSILGWNFPSSWFQSVGPLWVLLLAPAFAWLWVRLGRREPSSPAKFSYGLFFVGVGPLLLAAASSLSGGATDRVSPAWLILVYLAQTIGELCLSPVGLSTVTKLAPPSIVGLMMGVWFLSLALGNYIGGWVAGYFEILPLARLYGALFLATGLSALVLAFLSRPIRKLMGGVH